MTEVVEEQVVLVDERDNEVGVMPKLQAHVEGRLHRAISVFVINSQGFVLLQRRAAEKYHSPGLWTNACCSHPRPGERAHAAAIRRLSEEMGLIGDPAHRFAFLYRAEFPNGLVEHELDHVYLWTGDEDPNPDPDEVGDWRWVAPSAIAEELERDPDSFTPWFPLAFEQLRERGDLEPAAAPPTGH